MVFLLSVLFVIVLSLTLGLTFCSKITFIIFEPKNSKDIDSTFVSPFKYCSRMLTSSFLLILNVFHGYYNGIHDCSTLILICWINSVNYWRYPTEGIRRNIDLASSVISAYHHFYCSYEISNGNVYRIGVASFCVWYILALYFGRYINNKHYASLCHVNIHSTAIIFNLWLFEELYVARFRQ